MKRKTFENAPCQIARSLDILGDWWNPLILRECLYGVNRFDEFQKWLGIGRNILTQRLNFLVEEGLIKKRLYQSSPKRYEYVLSDQGYDACKVLLALMEYGEKWRFKKGKEPVHLFDRETGEQLYPTIVDRKTGEALDPRSLQIGPGPGFPRNKTIRKERFRNHTTDQH